MAIGLAFPITSFAMLKTNFLLLKKKIPHKKRDPQKISFEERMDDMYGGSGIDELADQERKEWSAFKGYFFSNHIVQVSLL